MEKVSTIQQGDTLAIVSPSWSGPACFSEVYKKGIKNLQEIGDFKIKEYETTSASPKENYNNPEKRAQDLIQAFNDPEVKGVVCSIGGDDCVRLLPYLDKYEITPKFFMGYSDSTVLLHYFLQRGFVVFHGPSVMAGFAYPQAVDVDFEKHIKEFLFGNWSEYVYTPYPKWSNKVMDWDKPDMTLEKHEHANSGWKIARGSNTNDVRGVLWGGSAEALEFVKGTKYWHQGEEFWQDKILLWEFADDGASLTSIKWILRNYGMQKVFENAQAILIGRLYVENESEKEQVEQTILQVIREEFNSNILVIFNADFGHTYPQAIFPLGVEASITCNGGEVSMRVCNPFSK